MIGATALAKPRFSGTLTLSDEAGYNEGRPAFNAMIDRRPAVIARCATTADVVASVNFGRENRALLAVRCGGHSVSGLGVCDGGLLIDLAGLKKIDVDPGAKTARAGGCF